MPGKESPGIEEMPIACVIVCNGQIIARGYNRRNMDKNTPFSRRIERD